MREKSKGTIILGRRGYLRDEGAEEKRKERKEITAKIRKKKIKEETENTQNGKKKKGSCFPLSPILE